jgi:hypothetical protein
VRKGTLTGKFEWLVRRDEPGLLHIGVAGINTLDSGAGGIVEVDFHVKPGAAPGMQLIDLQWAELNEGGLTLNPAPAIGKDATDSVVTIAAAALPRLAPAASWRSPVAPAAVPGANLQPGGQVQATPVIRWGTSAQPVPAVTGVGSGLLEQTRSGWTKDFVTGLGQSEEERDPNAAIRITLPATKQLARSTKPKPDGDAF